MLLMVVARRQVTLGRNKRMLLMVVVALEDDCKSAGFSSKAGRLSGCGTGASRWVTGLEMVLRKVLTAAG